MRDNADYYREAGIRLKAAMSARMTTHKRLSELLECSRESVTEMCNGSRTIKADEIVSIAKWLRVSPLYLLGIQENMQ